MWILAILWTVYLVGVCNCGDDTNVTKDVLKGTENKNTPESTHPESSLASKVVTSLFDLEESLEGSVKVLKLKAKEGATVKELKYDKKQIWSGKARLSKSSNLVEALIYFDGNIPVLTTIKAVKGGKESTVYRYHDGEMWKNGREGTHKSKLAELRKKYKSADLSGDKVAQSAGQIENDPSLKSDFGTIDLNNPDNSQCQAFDYYYDDNLTRLIAPLSEKSIEKLKDGTEKIWSIGSGETLQHAKAYLDKDKKPEVVFVVVKKSSGISRKYYVKNDIGWVETLLSFPERINELKAKATNKTDVTIDIGSEKETEQCYLISTELLGLEVKMFVPGVDYLVKEVKDGDIPVWKASVGANERCLSCDIYTKGNSNPLLLITLKINNELKCEYFEREGGEWKGIKKEEFSTKKNAMQTA